MSEFKLGNVSIGKDCPVAVIAEIGINHEGSLEKAKQMIDDAAAHGAHIVKFQMHIIDDEMVHAAKEVVPGNADESIWNIMERCRLPVEQHQELMAYCKKKGVEYLCTPFSRAAADELNKMGVSGFKIGSGECNNYPLVRHIASFGKPIILSTGMNNMDSIAKSVEILKSAGVPFAILQCTSMYPTPYEKVFLGALHDLKKFDCPVGLSDHSLGIYTSLGAVALGASIIEKHFTSDSSWPGPDVPISITPPELAELVKGVEAVKLANGGKKDVHPDEQPVINFAYASIVTTKAVKKGEKLSKDNLWVKRPGTGIPAEKYEEFLDKVVSRDIPSGCLLKEEDVLG